MILKPKKKLNDYKYFREKTTFIDGRIYCGEHGRCAVCGKKSMKYWIGFGIAQQFHFCSEKHRDLFIAGTGVDRKIKRR